MAASRPLSRRIIRVSFNTMVGAEIVVMTVPIVLAVCLIVFVLIADKVCQCETVMATDHVDAVLRCAVCGCENIGGPVQSLGKVTACGGIAQPESAH